VAEALRVQRLLPPDGSPAVPELVWGLGLLDAASEPATRPHVLLNMVSSADGRASVGGRSGPLGDRADHELFHWLRTAVDAVMAGAGTVRAERYGRLIRDPERRRARVERGLEPEPLACIVSDRLALDAETPLLANADSRVVIVTASRSSLPPCAAHVDYVRAERDGALDLAAAMEQLRERFGVRVLLCEGGPHLNSHLLAAEVVDELFLSLAAKLIGGDPASGEGLRIIAGPELEPPLQMRLLGVLEHESQLFLRYRVGA
jgi:riboflavin biosynthesis pyrimidine reductase